MSIHANVNADVNAERCNVVIGRWYVVAENDIQLEQDALENAANRDHSSTNTTL
jgi:hypothetical protein